MKWTKNCISFLQSKIQNCKIYFLGVLFNLLSIVIMLITTKIKIPESYYQFIQSSDNNLVFQQVHHSSFLSMSNSQSILISILIIDTCMLIYFSISSSGKIEIISATRKKYFLLLGIIILCNKLVLITDTIYFLFVSLFLLMYPLQSVNIKYVLNNFDFFYSTLLILLIMMLSIIFFTFDSGKENSDNDFQKINRISFNLILGVIYEFVVLIMALYSVDIITLLLLMLSVDLNINSGNSSVTLDQIGIFEIFALFLVIYFLLFSFKNLKEFVQILHKKIEKSKYFKNIPQQVWLFIITILFSILTLMLFFTISTIFDEKNDPLKLNVLLFLIILVILVPIAIVIKVFLPKVYQLKYQPKKSLRFPTRRVLLSFYGMIFIIMALISLILIPVMNQPFVSETFIEKANSSGNITNVTISINRSPESFSNFIHFYPHAMVINTIILYRYISTNSSIQINISDTIISISLVNMPKSVKLIHEPDYYKIDYNGISSLTLQIQSKSSLNIPPNSDLLIGLAYKSSTQFSDIITSPFT